MSASEDQSSHRGEVASDDRPSDTKKPFKTLDSMFKFPKNVDLPGNAYNLNTQVSLMYLVLSNEQIKPFYLFSCCSFFLSLPSIMRRCFPNTGHLIVGSHIPVPGTCKAGIQLS